MTRTLRMALPLLAAVLTACNAQVGTPQEASAQGVTVLVDPQTVTVAVGGSTTFAAAVSGAVNTAVTWSLTADNGGTVGAEAGTIDATGRYTAPNTTGTLRLMATSVADPSKSGTAVVTVAQPSSTDPTNLIPADRTVPWNPGLNAVGGIPNRTSVCATLSPSGGDDTTLVQNALNACAVDGVVKLNAGTFRISGLGLTVPSGRVLRGSGPTQTLLVKAAGSGTPVIIVGARYATDNDSKYAATNLATDAVRGSSTVTLASNPGLTVGEIVLLDETTDTNLTNWGTRTTAGMKSWFCRTDRPIAQVMEVASVSGTTVTFSTPFHSSYRVSHAGQLSRYAAGAASTYSGIEDLYVSGGEGGDGGGNIHFYHAAYSWVKNVEADKNHGTSVNLDGTFRCVLRDSYVHSALNPSPGGDGYLIGLNRGAADNLVENNISWNGNKVIVMRATGGGNVIGYNYMEDGWGSGYPSIPEVGLNAAHMTTPHHELFEGNESWNFDGDSVWGNSIYITVFRNHLTGKRRSITPLALTDVENRRVIGLTMWHWWYSFLGNVLGTSDMTGDSTFVYERNTFNTSTPVPMWKLGYDGSNGSTPQDQTVVQRTLRHGNYDYVSNSVHWDSTISRQDLPDSLYLTAKPVFFGSNPWPWVMPETPGAKTATLPARARFDALHGL